MKRKFSTTIAAMLCALMLCSSAAAIPQNALNQVSYAIEQGGQIVPQVERTKWYFRNYYGKAQKRLWSLTEGRWLTDWIDIN